MISPRQVDTIRQRRETRKSIKFKFDQLFDANKLWSQAKMAEDPNYFINLSKAQHPKYLWIGCSDSRVPANNILGLGPGELFVQRNIANLCLPTDINCQSVMNYAILHLKVEQIIICGHYGCGGIKHSMERKDFGFLNAWLTHIEDIEREHLKELKLMPNFDAKFRRMVELNVIAQCQNVIKNSVYQELYRRNGYPAIRGCVYDIENGHLTDLKFDYREEIKNVMTLFAFD